MAVEYAPRNRRGVLRQPAADRSRARPDLWAPVSSRSRAHLLSDDAFLAWGWRIAFMLSAILVVVGLYIRLKVMETPAFRKLEEREEKAAVPAVEMFSDRLNRRTSVLGHGLRAGPRVSPSTRGRCSRSPTAPARWARQGSRSCSP